MLVVLDRDGVINEDSDAYIRNADQWQPIPGSLAAIAQLNARGFKVAVATNQSGLARKYFSLSTLHLMHEKMQSLLAKVNGKIDYIAYCPHGPSDNCRCRKPNVGMLEEIEKRFDEVPSYFIGDSFKDIEAAKRYSIKPILVKTGKGLQTLNTHKNDLVDVLVVDNLSQAAQWIVEQESE